MVVYVPSAFTPVNVTTSGSDVLSLGIADVAGTGVASLVGNNVANSPGSLAWFQVNNSTSPPTFSPQTVSNVFGYASYITAQDMNRDGAVDIVVVDTINSKVSLLLNNGGSPRSFTRTTPLTAVASAGGLSGPIVALAAAMNNDSHLDLVVLNRVDGTLAWFASSGGLGPVFGPRVDILRTSGSSWLTTCDSE